MSIPLGGYPVDGSAGSSPLGTDIETKGLEKVRWLFTARQMHMFVFPPFSTDSVLKIDRQDLCPQDILVRRPSLCWN